MLVEILNKIWEYHSYGLYDARSYDPYGKKLLGDAIKVAKEQELRLKEYENKICMCGKSNGQY